MHNLGKTIQNCLPETTKGFQDNCLLSFLFKPSTTTQQDNFDCLADYTSSSPSAHLYTHDFRSLFFKFFIKNLLGIVYSSFHAWWLLDFSCFQTNLCRIFGKKKMELFSSDLDRFCVGRSTLCGEVIHTLLLSNSCNSALNQLKLGFLVHFGGNWI